MAARWWMTCALVDQTKEGSVGGRPVNWTERKITRVHGQSDTNGELAVLPLVEQNKSTDRVHAPRASTQSTKNSHLLVRDEYPEVIPAEKAAEAEITYNIPHIAPEITVGWARKLVLNRAARFDQMDPICHHHMN